MNMKLVALVGLIAAGPAAAQGLMPQAPVVGKTVAQQPVMTTDRLVVKFRDDADIRVRANGMLESGQQPGAGPNALEGMAGNLGLSFEPYLKIDRSKIEALRQKVKQHTGKLGPDLGRIMYVTVGDPKRLAETRAALAQMPEIEWADWDWEIKSHSTTSARPLAAEMGPALPAGMIGGGGGETPDFTGAQTWYTIDNGGYDLADLHDRGQWILDNNLQVPEWPGGNGARGAQVRVGVIDFAAWVEHEDLAPVNMEPGVPMLPPGIDPDIFGGYNHGGACLGIIGARDNGFGMTGIAPECELWFFPSISFSGGRLAEAFIGAYTILEYGDILSVSLGLGDRPLYFADIHATLMAMGEAVGVTTFISAGNDSNDLTDLQLPAALEDATSLPCIVVGAGFPFFRPDTPTGGGTSVFVPFSRLGFTNFHLNNDAAVDSLEARVHVQSWGIEVPTLGYGDLFLPDGDDFSIFNRSYTAEFSGTSAACPLAAGVGACVQGLARMFFGTPLRPDQVRSVIAGNVFRQELTPNDVWVSHSPDPDDTPPGDGNPATVNDNVQIDPDTGGPIEESELIGGMTRIDNMLSNFFTGEWFSVDTEVKTFGVLAGTHVDGGVIRLGVQDGVGIRVSSQFVSPRHRPHVPPYPTPTYIFHGEGTDIGIEVIPTTSNDLMLTANVEFAAGTTGGAPFGGIRGLEVWNWSQSRWDFLSVEAVPPGITPGGGGMGFAQEYFNVETRQFLFRIWVYGYSFSRTNTIFETTYDYFNFGSTSGGLGGGSE